MPQMVIFSFLEIMNVQNNKPQRNQIPCFKAMILNGSCLQIFILLNIHEGQPNILVWLQQSDLAAENVRNENMCARIL